MTSDYDFPVDNIESSVLEMEELDFDQIFGNMDSLTSMDYNAEGSASRSYVKEDKPSKSKRKNRRRKRMLTGVSKQRRAANERERKRLQIINMAFNQLKSILPLLPGEETISKIEIIRLASRTISFLAGILSGEIIAATEQGDRESTIDTDTKTSTGDAALSPSEINSPSSLSEESSKSLHDGIFTDFFDDFSFSASHSLNSPTRSECDLFQAPRSCT